MNNTTLVQLIEAATVMRESLDWYSKHADGNSPEKPDDGDVIAIKDYDLALANLQAEMAAVNAEPVVALQAGGDRTHLLKEWRVIYRASGSDDPTENRLMTFQAEDVPHVLEQLEGALTEDDIVQAIVASDGLSLVPEAEDGFAMNPATNGAWVTVKNISVRLFHKEGYLKVTAHSLGDEMEEAGDGSIEASFSVTAMDFLCGSDDSVEGIRDHAGHHDGFRARAHLAAYVESDPDDQTGFGGRVREALAEQLAQS